MSEIETWFIMQKKLHNSMLRPLVTLTWSQCTDDSGAALGPAGVRYDESRELTHWLRTVNDVVVVGIGTVISDNPALEVNLVAGRNPTAVILDTHLRIPDETHLLKRNSGFPWIVVGSSIEFRRVLELEKRGNIILEVPEDENGRIDLKNLLAMLRRMGMGSILVEGGVQVMASFLRENLADLVVITSKSFNSGENPSRSENPTPPYTEAGLFPPMLVDAGSESFGTDLVTWGRIK